MFQLRFSRTRAVTLTLVSAVIIAPLLLIAPAHASPAMDAEEALFCSLINDYRASKGLPAVKMSPRLTNAAAWMSTDMATNDYVDHTDSTGRSFGARLQAFGYTSSGSAENLTAGMPDAVNAFLGWQNSSAHNSIMLKSNAKVMGIARAYDATSSFKWYWTADFGTTEDAGTVACPNAPITVPTVTINDVTKSEGTAGTPINPFTFTLTLSHATVKPVSLWYTTHDITATGGSDYEPAAKKITIPAGEIRAWFSISVFKDNVPEPDETFWVLLSNAENAVIGGTALGKGTILNDDGPMVPTLLINDVSVVEGTGPGTTNAVFTLTLSHATDVNSSVWYTTYDITATGGSDYVPTSKKAVIPAGSTSLDIAIPIIRDSVPEEDETFWVLLSVPENLIVGGTALGKGTIIDDD